MHECDVPIAQKCAAHRLGVVFKSFFLPDLPIFCIERSDLVLALLIALNFSKDSLRQKDRLAKVQTCFFFRGRNMYISFNFFFYCWEEKVHNFVLICELACVSVSFLIVKILENGNHFSWKI